MKSLILSIVLALSMVAVAFAAIPTTAAVYYTGSVQATDGTGAPRNLFFYNPSSGDSERIYVNVSLEYMGVPTDMAIEVELIGPTGEMSRTGSGRTQTTQPLENTTAGLRHLGRNGSTLAM